MAAMKYRGVTVTFQYDMPYARQAGGFGWLQGALALIAVHGAAV